MKRRYQINREKAVRLIPRRRRERAFAKIQLYFTAEGDRRCATGGCRSAHAPSRAIAVWGRRWSEDEGRTTARALERRARTKIGQLRAISVAPSHSMKPLEQAHARALDAQLWQSRTRIRRVVR